MLLKRLTLRERRTALLLVVGFAAWIYSVVSNGYSHVTELPPNDARFVRTESNVEIEKSLENARKYSHMTGSQKKDPSIMRNESNAPFKQQVEKTRKNSHMTGLIEKDTSLMRTESNGTLKKKEEKTRNNSHTTGLTAKDVSLMRNESKGTLTMKVEKIHIPDDYKGGACPYTLDLPQDEILEKVTSYEFPGIKNYIQDLFPKSDDKDPPRDPVFVSGFSSNHYEEGLAMIFNFKQTINRNKTTKLIIYDIGLTKENATQVAKECECEVRTFPFDKFPDHVRILKGYAWKPLIIQLVAKEHRSVVWLDASIRFKTTNITDLIQRARRHGVLATRGFLGISHQTSIETFRYLNEPPCLYRRSPETETNFVFIYQTAFIEKYLMIPWVSCALVRGCMVPYKDVDKILDCNGPRVYFHCHRFEQSVLGILINRHFHKTVTDHYLTRGELFDACRECKRKVLKKFE